MITTDATLEREIVGLLEHQKSIYSRAWKLLEPAAGPQVPQNGYESLLLQLNTLMEEAATNERILRDRWNAWESHQYDSTNGLRASWEATESELRRLIERVELVTQRAQAARDAMMPALASGHAHSKMRAAYGSQE